MIGAMIYTTAIILHMAMKDESVLNDKFDDELNRSFATISMCMWTLLLDGTFLMDGAGIVLTDLLLSGTVSSVISCIVFMVFVLLSALTVMNMLIGVLCRVVTAVAEGEMDDAAIRLVKESILVDLRKFDDGNGMMTHDALVQVMCDPQSKAVLKSLNVDRLFLMELQRMLFPKPGSQVPIKNLMELMLMCRGDLPVTVKALSSGLSYISTIVHKFEHRVTANMEVLRNLVSDQRMGVLESASVASPDCNSKVPVSQSPISPSNVLLHETSGALGDDEGSAQLVSMARDIENAQLMASPTSPMGPHEAVLFWNS
jgi:hypothetical protein